MHYRDLDSVEHELAEAEQGRFRIEPLMFHLAGIPSYLVVGELAINEVLRGDLPKPDYPEALRKKAPEVWWNDAKLTFGYAASNHAPQARSAQCAGLLVQATTQAAHAVLAARAEWVTNEKTLLTRAGLRQIDEILAGVHPSPKSLSAAVEAARRLCEGAVQKATA